MGCIFGLPCGIAPGECCWECKRNCNNRCSIDKEDCDNYVEGNVNITDYFYGGCKYEVEQR